jgi:predicted TIM-barrel fold metal-dependent hydrolase
MMEIFDAHTHWGPSVSLNMTVTTEELLKQAQQSGVDRIVIFPFPSMALSDETINDKLLEVRKKDGRFIPYYYIPEDLRSIPLEKHYWGGKWHWMRGIQDCSSNYQVLDDPELDHFIQTFEEVGLPIVFEEELAFTEAFVKRTKDLKMIIPHLGMLGGNPFDFLQTFKGRENVFFDTALAGTETIMRFIKNIGKERILFGSDIPFGTMKRELEKILSLPIRDDEKEWIFSKNLKRLIGWDGKRNH